MNQGLRSYCKLLSQDIGNAGKAFVNVNQTNANFNLVIPIYKTTGNAPIELSLIYSYADRTTATEFGFGVKMNFYRKYTLGSGKATISVANSDGSVDVFTRIGTTDNYECKLIHSTLEVTWTQPGTGIDQVIYKDKYGNRMASYGYRLYPNTISLINGDSYSFIFDVNNNIPLEIRNQGGTRVYFSYDGTAKITSVVFALDAGSRTMFTAQFAYSSSTSTISDIVYINNYPQDTTLFTNTYQLNQTIIKVTDGLSQYRIYYTISDNRVTYFEDGVTSDLSGGSAITLTYNGNYTLATDSKARQTYYYFDPHQVPLYDIDYKARAVAYHFDYDQTEGTIELISKTNPVMNNPLDTASTNLIANGYFSSNLDNWTVSGQGTATVITDTSNLFHAILGDKTLSATSTNNGSVVVTQTVACSGIAFDDVTLSIWGHEMVCGSMSAAVLATAKVQLLRGATPVASGTINFTKYNTANAPWELVAVSATPQKSYDTLVVTLTVSSNSTYAFDAIQVIRSPMGSNNQYDEQGNVVTHVAQKSTTDAEYTTASSTPSNLPSQTLSPTSTLFDYEYDAHGNVTKVKTAYEVTTTYTYDTSNNPTDTVVSSGSAAMKTSKAYSALGYPTSKTDDTGATTSFEFDNSLGRLTRATAPTGTTLGYAYDSFNNYLSSTISRSGNSISAAYGYDTLKRLKTITTPNNDVYKFTYNTWNRVVDLCVGPTEALATHKLFTYEYQNQENPALEQTGNITKVIYGNSGGAYTFTYNNIDQITAVNYIAPGGTTSTQKYGYSYDSLGRITMSETILASSTIQTEFSYNAAGQLTSMNDDIGNAINYTYDALGTAIQKKYSHQGTNEYIAVDPEYRSDGMNTQAVYAKFQNSTHFVAGFMNEFVYDEETQQYTDVRSLDLLGVSIDGSKVSLSPSVSTGLVASLYNLVPCVRFTSTNGRLAYDVHAYTSWGPNASIAFWFKIEDAFENKTLFSTIAPSGAFIRVFFTATGRLNLELKENDGTIHTGLLVTDTAFLANQWNFFALSWTNSLGTGVENKCVYRLWLNNEKKAFQKSNPRYYVDNGNPLARLFIGCFFDGTSQLGKMNGRVTAILTSDTLYQYPYELDEYYRWTKEYLIANSFVNPLYDTVYAGGLNLYSRNQTFLNDYEVIPLNSNLLSFKGKAPKYMTLRKTTDFDRDRTFNYNQTTLRYSYVADGSELAYDFNAQESGFIGMKVCLSGEGVKQYLFQNTDSLGKPLGLYRQLNHASSTSRSTLSIEINGTTLSTGIPLDNGIWTPIGFTWSKTIISDSVPSYQYQLRLVVGRQEDSSNPYVYTTMVTFDTSLGAMVTSIGRTRYGRLEPDGLGGYVTVYDPLYGQIEMLCWKNAYLSQATILSVWEDMKVTTISHQYDVFGRMQLNSMSTDASFSPSIQTYEYAARTGDPTKTSTRVASESFRFADTSQNMDHAYSYDGNGNVISIADGQTTTSYEYDYRNFLTQENGPNAAFKYVYDANGNITSKRLLNNTPVKTFTYDTSSSRILSDRLVGVGSYKIKYIDTTSVGNPISCAVYDGHNVMLEGDRYSWEGRKLTRFRHEEFQTTLLDVNYAYDANGLRIQKKVGNTFHDYFYDGGNLVSEVVGNTYLRFGYDEKGLLSCLTYNDGTTSTRYFYVRDILLNIIGLKDVLENLVVRYNYDAWGNLVSITGSGANTVGQTNPFRYKGYYYDTETMMYYCHTRYYVPEWCRWLNADNPNYLDSDSPKGVNLCAYCGNNPLIGYDPSGTFDWGKFWMTVGSVAAIIGGIVLCATGVGGILGSVLLGAGAGSLINGYVNEANGGSFIAGWLGGLVSGALCGMGAGLGGLAFTAATEVADIACFGYLFLGTTVSFAGGFAGNFLGTLATAAFDHKKIDDDELGSLILNSAVMGALNVFAGIGSSITGIAAKMAKEVGISLSSKIALRVYAGVWAGGTEFAYDSISNLYSIILGLL